MEVSTDRQIETILQTINVLGEDLEKATVKALNATIGYVKNSWDDDFDLFFYKDKRVLRTIRSAIVASKAKKRDLNAKLLVKKGYIKLADFSDKRQTPVGVYAGGIVYRHAFIARMYKGAPEGVYRRVYKTRLPIKPVFHWYIDRLHKAVDKMLENGLVSSYFEKEFLRLLKEETGAL